MSENWIESKINEGEIIEYKFEEFEECKMIGAGAFSRVYKAKQRSTKNIYALKMIENKEHINKELVNELKHMTSVKSHKNIIEFYGISKYKDPIDPSVIKYVLILEYADGGTLHDYLKNNATKIEWDLKIQFAIQLVDATTLPLKIRNGLREEPVADTNHKYITIYEQCWQGMQDKRPSIQEVAMELKNIIAQDVAIDDNFNIKDIKSVEKFLDDVFGIIKFDLNDDLNKDLNDDLNDDDTMTPFANNLYSIFNKQFNEGRSVSSIITNFIAKHNKTQKEVFDWLLKKNNDDPSIGTGKDDAESFKLFFKAASKDDVIAQYFVGRCYEIGWNTKKNTKKAIEWYNKAIENNCAAAERMLGEYYYKNDKYVQAFKLFKSAADRGNIIAKNNLGICYQKGRGTDANIERRSIEGDDFDFERKSIEEGGLPKKNNEPILGILTGAGYNINQIIGAGIFQNPGEIWMLVQSPGIALILWIIGGFVSLLGSLVYIELGIRTFPSGIGEQKYIEDAFPHTRNLGHIFSFVAIFAIFPGGIIADSYTSAKYFLYAIQGDDQINKIILPITAIIILGIIMGYHIISNKLSVNINQTLAFIKLLSLFIISVVGLVKLSNTNNWNNIFNTHSTKLGDYTEAIMKVLFAYGDFLTNAAFITEIDYNNYANMTTENHDKAIAINFVGDNELGKRFMSMLIALSSFGSVGAMFFAYARITEYAAGTGFMPKISNLFDYRNKKLGTPTNAYVAQFFYCAILTGCFSIYGENPFGFFSDSSQYLSTLFQGVSGICLIILKKRSHGVYDGFQTPIFITIIYLIFVAFMTIASFGAGDNESNDESIKDKFFEIRANSTPTMHCGMILINIRKVNIRTTDERVTALSSKTIESSEVAQTVVGRRLISKANQL
ncbi:28048_t:CDS:10 [Gigaspora margarita]|uniref:28048_t:CDS:1 n=1 Tax=Gigaspora margarita TaxID=4874 RepID=A0ABM8W2X2_GIGMA|nr:28048_t:CDS:10 [Gigaspora margarita]